MASGEFQDQMVYNEQQMYNEMDGQQMSIQEQTPPRTFQPKSSSGTGSTPSRSQELVSQVQAQLEQKEIELEQKKREEAQRRVREAAENAKMRRPELDSDWLSKEITKGVKNRFSDTKEVLFLSLYKRDVPRS